VKSNIDLATKKDVLNHLIDQYLLVDEAYRMGADKRADFTNRMEFTRTLILSDLLVTRDVQAKAKTGEDYNRLLDALQNRLFDAATIEVSPDSYELLKKATREINALNEAPDPSAKGHSQSSARTREAMAKTPDAVLARYDAKQITVKQILAIYASLRT